MQNPAHCCLPKFCHIDNIYKNKTSSKLLSETIWLWIVWPSVCSNVCNGVCNLSDYTGWLRRRVKRGLVHQIHLYGLLTYLCFLCTSMFSYVLVIVQYFFLYRKYHTMIDDIILHLSCHKHPFVLIRVFIYGSSTFCSFKCLENQSICKLSSVVIIIVLLKYTLCVANAGSVHWPDHLPQVKTCSLWLPETQLWSPRPIYRRRNFPIWPFSHSYLKGIAITSLMRHQNL